MKNTTKILETNTAAGMGPNDVAEFVGTLTVIVRHTRLYRNVPPSVNHLYTIRMDQAGNLWARPYNHVQLEGGRVPSNEFSAVREQPASTARLRRLALKAWVAQKMAVPSK